MKNNLCHQQAQLMKIKEQLSQEILKWSLSFFARLVFLSIYDNICVCVLYMYLYQLKDDEMK